MYTSMAQLDNLQNQIALLKQQQQLSPLPTQSLSIQEQIQQAVQQELAKYIPQAKPAEPEVPLTPQQLMEKEINELANSVLTKEQVTWISDPVVFKGIPLFLKSKRGKEAISLLLEEYKTYVDGE